MRDVFLELVESFAPVVREDEDVQCHILVPDEILGFNAQVIEIVAEHISRRPHTLPRMVVCSNLVEPCGDFSDEVQPSYPVGDEDEVQVVPLPIPRHAPEEFHAVNVRMAHENLCHLFRLRTVDENWFR